jgi:hypothetical protein
MDQSTYFIASIILSTAMVVVTVVMVILNWQANKRAREIINVNREYIESNYEIFELQNRPYVVVNCSSSDGHIYIYLENIGKTPAYYFTMDIDPDIDNILDTNDRTMKNFKKKDIIPPNVQFRDKIAWTSPYVKMQDIKQEPNLSEEQKEHKIKEVIKKYKIRRDTKSINKFTFKFRYFGVSKDGGKKLYEERYTIDLNLIVWSDKMREFTLNKYVKEIGDHVKKTNELLDEYLKKK